MSQGISVVANDETLIKHAVKYIKKLDEHKMLKKEEDDSLMTEEEFSAKLERAHEQHLRGEGIVFTNKEEMNDWLNSL